MLHADMNPASMQAQPRGDVIDACSEVVTCGKLGALGPIQLLRVQYLPLHVLVGAISVEASLRYPDSRPRCVVTFNKPAEGIRSSEAFRDENAVEYSLSQHHPVLDGIWRSVRLKD